MFRPLLPRATFRRPLRPYATTPPTTRLARLESRLPRFLRRYTTPLRTAPVSHITAFLLLHELTAIIPLFGLAAIFHYTNWLPPYISEGRYISEGTAMFGRYLRKKGWVSDEDGSRGGRFWGMGEGGVRVVSELATAYAITKVLLPVRLVVSVWGTPWFARWTVLPVTGWVKRTRVVGWVRGLWTRGGSAKAAAVPAAGTGAVGAGVVVPKEGGKVK